jgi:hypothetical protein
MFLASFYLTTQLPKITKGWEAEGLEKEAKVCFIPLNRCFSLQLLPLQLFQDHRNSNLEASGVAMTCSFHQAVPRSLQVTVPVREDWKREQLLKHEDLSLSMGVK